MALSTIQIQPPATPSSTTQIQYPTMASSMIQIQPPATPSSSTQIQYPTIALSTIQMQPPAISLTTQTRSPPTSTSTTQSHTPLMSPWKISSQNLTTYPYFNTPTTTPNKNMTTTPKEIRTPEISHLQTILKAPKKTIYKRKLRRFSRQIKQTIKEKDQNAQP